MSPDKDAALRKAYPLLFRNRLMNDEPIRCRDGWYTLLHILCCGLEKLISEQPESSQARFYAEQVKEKFGGLRFYMTRATDEMSELIAKAEKTSLSLCDVCGDAGKPRGGEPHQGWYRTRCDAHDGVRGAG